MLAAHWTSIAQAPSQRLVVPIRAAKDEAVALLLKVWSGWLVGWLVGWM
jgi:hypothetical protein